jgi:hypothetical protein
VAFGDSWLISVMLRFSSNGAQVLRGMNQQLGAVEGRVDRVTAAMNRLNAATTRVAGGLAAIGVGIGIYAETQAAQLQRTLTAIKNETGADPRKMGLITNSVFSIGNQIGVSPVEAARTWLDISRMTAGQLSVAQMLKIAPNVAQFASLLHYNRPDVSVEAATLSGLQLVHMFRAYQPEKLVPLLDKVYRLSGLMGETPGQAVRQLSYYEPLFKGLKIDDQTSIAMMALLDRAGFRMKVGTNVRAMMLEALGPLQTTGHAQRAKLDYLEQMGVFGPDGRFAWNTPSGGVNYLGMLNQLANWESGKRKSGVPASDIYKIMFSVFGKQGGNIAALMADPQLVAFLGQIRSYQRNPNVGLAAGLRNREDTLSFQAGRAWGNLTADFTELGLVQVPRLTRGFRALADELHGIQAWLHGHRGAEQAISAGFIGLTGLMAGRFALGALGKVGEFLGVTRAAGALRTVDVILTGGLIGKMINLGKGIAGLEVAGAEAKNVTALGTGIRTLSGAAQAAIGLSALGAAIGVVTTALGFWFGIAKNISDAANNPALAKLLQWSTTGNYGGIAPPGTFRVETDPAGHVIEIHDHTSGGIRSKVRTRGAIFTSPRSPGILNLTSPSLGLHP